MQSASLLKRLTIKRKNNERNLLKYGLYLSKFAQDYILKTGCYGYVLGLSGGVDSALCLALLSETKDLKIIGVFIDIDSDERDRQDAESLKAIFKFEYQYIDLSDEYHSLVKKLKIENNRIARENLKVRLRASALYAVANAHMLMVCGTTNAAERLVGYFTKYGDNACDINLLYFLNKTQIRYLAQQYKIPMEIVLKAPSAGLSPGQTDETDLGVTYDQIDHYLSFAVIDPVADTKITTRYIVNKHKKFTCAKPKKFMSLRNCGK